MCVCVCVCVCVCKNRLCLHHKRKTLITQCALKPGTNNRPCTYKFENGQAYVSL